MSWTLKSDVVLLAPIADLGSLLLGHEPRHYSDSPNHFNFPAIELKSGQTYRNTIEYKSSVE